ncbi:hypothetical protein MKZ38_009758 [Zalerion maritima]|uniref:Uncharacterized protein n=1 Tax=Zalerion maritima TaxID=339359 RepID=A0AAD5RYJ1_9PEZI|nr:hypothetical protein MKZ38_009758 [Zalerion maritima]
MTCVSQYVKNVRKHFALCPYIPGATITLNCTSDGKGSSPFKGPIKLRILSVVSTSGHSVILEAKPLGESCSNSTKFPSSVVVKLYDHRFSERLRSEEAITPPTRSSIREYLTYVSSGGARRFIKRLHHHDKMLRAGRDEITATATATAGGLSGGGDGMNSSPTYTGSYPEYIPTPLSRQSGGRNGRSSDGSPTSSSHLSSQHSEGIPEDWDDDVALSHWTPAQDETYLYHKASKRFQAEKNVYNRLRRLQGTAIPKILGMASVKIGFPKLSIFEKDEIENLEHYGAHKRLFDANGWLCMKGVDSHLLSVKALVMEKVEGFSMADMTAHAPRCLFTKLVDEAMEIIHVTGMAPCEILNENVSPNNFMISPLPEDRGYRVVMMNFSESQIRAAEETNERWYHRKWNQAEIALFGLEMETILKRIGYRYKMNSHDSRITYWAEYLF